MRETVRKIKSECTGCGACASICPKGAIAMTEDEEGFLLVRADPQLLTQVIINLVNNAFNHGGADVHVWVRTYMDGHDAVIEVEDDGEVTVTIHNSYAVKKGSLTITKNFQVKMGPSMEK